MGAGVGPTTRVAAAASPGQRAMAQAVNRIHTVILSNTEVDVPFDAAELVVVRDDGDLIDVVDAVKRRPGGDIGAPAASGPPFLLHGTQAYGAGW